jgi:predicted nucleic acid-binding protein
VNVYADSSFIVALYLQQQRSPKAIDLLQRYGRPLPFTPWHRLEVRNAIRLAIWQTVIDSAVGKKQLRQLETDIKEEAVLVHEPIEWTNVLRDAEKLGSAHNEKIGCRSADLFHIAVAREIGCDTLWTFDTKQTAMAEAAGLTVAP